MRDIDVSISEAQAAYRSVFLVEMLLRLLARKLIAHNRVGVREACERALGRGARHTAPLPVVVDQSLLSTVDELNYCSLGELTRIIFDSDLHKTLDGWVAPADTNQLKIHIQLVQQLRNALAHFWPVRFTPDLTAPLRTLSTVLVTVLAEAGADDPEFQQLKRLQAAEVDLGSSRRLDWARLGIPHPDVISAVAEHMVKPHRENQAIQGLAPFLSHTLQLGPAITFRASTTQMFRAVLECVTLHAIGHSSRPGEEGMFAARMIAPSNRSSPRLGKLVYSDVDHPAMQHTIQAMWRRAGGGVTRVHLADLVCGPGQGDARAAVVRRYLDAVHAGGVSIVLLPHVVWINGAILDVRQICAAIREADPLIVTVIDGAQAVGHLPLEVESSDAENEDVDFYLGCGHKWLGGPEGVGFGRIGRRFAAECPACLATLASGDAVSHPGVLAPGYDGAQTTWGLRGLARGLTEALRLRSSAPGGFQATYPAIRYAADHIRAGLEAVGEIRWAEPPLSMRSGIVSVTGPSPRLRTLHEALSREGFHAPLYPLPSELRRTFRGHEFLQFSPGPRISADDLAAVEALFRRNG